jgi:hypothetical protein
MCSYYYLHRHHVPPCTRGPDIAVHWEYCALAATDPATGRAAGDPCGSAACSSAQSIDAADPCASGGCLVSPECSSGQCRLEELGGRWACCQCGRGANVLRWCSHKSETSPDTFCYHRVCGNCTGDG